VIVDNQGQQWGEVEHSVDLGVESPLAGQNLNGLYSSLDQRLLVAETAADIASRALLVDLSSGAVTTIGTTLDPSGRGFLAWTFDSKQIIFQPETPIGEVWLIDLTTQSHQVLPLPTSEYSGYSIVRAAAFSPDGTILADACLHQSTGPGLPSEVEIGLLDFHQGTRVALLRLPGEEVVPHSLSWSPDGRTLICAVMTGLGDVDEGNDSIQLWTVNVEQKTADKIADGLTLQPPSWSPDGQWVAFLKTKVSPWSVKRPPANIYVLDIQMGREEQVTAFSTEPIVYLAWSPDGKSLGFTISKGDYGEIWVIGIDGASSHPVAGPTTPGAPFIWLSLTEGGK
jgi:Tol biopolymer transport system component